MKGEDTPTRKILWILPFKDPLSGNTGGRARVRYLFHIFKELNAEISLLLPELPLTEYPIKVRSYNLSFKRLNILKKFFLTFMSFNPKYIHEILSFLKEINDREMIIQTMPNGALFTLFLKKIKNIGVTYDAHNVEIERYSQYALTTVEGSTFKYWLNRLRITINEFIMAKYADHIFTISYRDKKEFSRIYNINPEKIIVVPPNINIKDAPWEEIKKRSSVKRYVLVFHGTYTYIPNREAIEIIQKEIAPKVKEATFVIAGTAVPKQHSKGNVSFIGFVENLNTFLSSCDIAIVPLKRGAGIKIKILDYMVAGLPIVTTKKGAEGLDLINNKHAIIVNDVNEEFIASIKYLIVNPKIRKKIGHNAKKLIKKKYSKESREVWGKLRWVLHRF